MTHEPTRVPEPASCAAARTDAGRTDAGRCPWCGFPSRPVAVHGHVQCATCGVNVDPCCGGETACLAGDDDAPRGGG